jgi:hypothetical protein
MRNATFHGLSPEIGPREWVPGRARASPPRGFSSHSRYVEIDYVTVDIDVSKREAPDHLVSRFAMGAADERALMEPSYQRASQKGGAGFPNR